MKKDLGVKSAIFPMPVLMIATYNEDESVDVMNAAWGMMVDMDKIVLNLSESHKTVKNIMERKAFTVSLADSNHVIEADYFGIISANKLKDKFEKSKLHSIKSKNVDAPVIEEFKITIECEFIEFQDNQNGCGVIGKIVNVLADESILDENQNIDVQKSNIIMYDTFKNGYYEVGKKVGNAFEDGKKLI